MYAEKITVNGWLVVEKSSSSTSLSFIVYSPAHYHTMHLHNYSTNHWMDVTIRHCITLHCTLHRKLPSPQAAPNIATSHRSTTSLLVPQTRSQRECNHSFVQLLGSLQGGEKDITQYPQDSFLVSPSGNSRRMPLSILSAQEEISFWHRGQETYPSEMLSKAQAIRIFWLLFEYWYLEFTNN